MLIAEITSLLDRVGLRVERQPNGKYLVCCRVGDSVRRSVRWIAIESIGTGLRINCPDPEDSIILDKFSAHYCATRICERMMLQD